MTISVIRELLKGGVWAINDAGHWHAEAAEKSGNPLLATACYPAHSQEKKGKSDLTSMAL
jgi:hypothetical protein